MEELAGKAVIITGSGRGLGRAFARDAARAGAAVVVNDLDATVAHRVEREIRADGGHVAAVVGSVSDAGVAERLVRTCVERFGRLDGLVNNAGLIRYGKPWEFTSD